MAARQPRSASDHESDDESYEVLDLTEYARRHHWWNRVFGRNSGPIVEKYSVATQIAMGGVTGWCAGFLFQKVGKLAATAVGGGFLLLQIASHSGYVQVDWKRVEKDVNKAKKQLKKRANKAAPEINTLIEETTRRILMDLKGNVLRTGKGNAFPHSTMSGYNTFSQDISKARRLAGLNTTGNNIPDKMEHFSDLVCSSCVSGDRHRPLLRSEEQIRGSDFG
ncbi:FUN14 domain-containing protein 1 isoform X1 [Alligator mississippiensis]|uniref:FUN14 domain-containing protein 1 isoform X1 n=2 Tax=Alligator mississippiensis TaxID=8496 RepID=UPI0028772F7D|nr:FUN14 domain-containing protein 1 isoform X1 [Alligator mississippiensis]